MPNTMVGLDEVMANLKQVQERTIARMAVEMEVFGVQTANQMKANRPWQDRTGNARRSLSSSTSKVAHGISTAIGIGVSYGVYLELAFGGRYRIVQPTQDSNRSRFMNALRGALTK